MTLRALRADDTVETEGQEIPSWGGACPREEQNDAGSLSDLRVEVDSHDQPSGVKDINPDDTIQQPEAPRHVRRRTGPRKRVSLKADSVRDALEKQYRQEGDWDELVDLYMGRIEAVEPAERVELFKRLGEVLWQELGDATAARDALVEALSIDPADEDAAGHLEDIAASKDGGWKALVDAVAQKIDVAEENPKKARLAERVVRWARGDMNDPATAERHLAAMRSYDPAHPLVPRAPGQPVRRRRSVGCAARVARAGPRADPEARGSPGHLHRPRWDLRGAAPQREAGHRELRACAGAGPPRDGRALRAGAHLPDHRAVRPPGGDPRSTGRRRPERRGAGRRARPPW